MEKELWSKVVSIPGKPINGIRDYDKFKSLLEKKYGHKIVDKENESGYTYLVFDDGSMVKVYDEFKTRGKGYGIKMKGGQIGRYKSSHYEYSEFGYIPAEEKSKAKKTSPKPNLNNVVGLHPSWKNWANFLLDAELRETKNGIKHYISSNGHYIVMPDGEVITLYGYHGQNAFNEIVENPKKWLAERDKALAEVRELLHPKDESGSSNSELQSIEQSRSERSRESDERQSNALTIDPDDPRVEIWKKHPDRMDVRGIDTPKKHKKGSAKKRRNPPSGMQTMR